MNILEREPEFSKVFLINKQSIRCPVTLTAYSLQCDLLFIQLMLEASKLTFLV